MNLKKTSLILALICAMPSLAWADEDTENIYNFLSGSYLLIGQKVNSNETYSGTIVLKYNESKKEFDVTRTIKGVTVKGTGKIINALGGESKMLQLHFTEGKAKLVGHYLFHSDLDNYGRISGYTSLEVGQTNQPGLEAFFINQQ